METQQQNKKVFLKIDEKTLRWLKMFKVKHNFKTINDVLVYLIQIYEKHKLCQNKKE